MLELCDRRLGTTVRASAVDDDVNLISNLISTDASKRDTGYKPALYVGGFVAVDVIFSFPVSLSAIQFSTITSKKAQAQIWVSSDVPSEIRTKQFNQIMTRICSCYMSPPSPTITITSTTPSTASVSTGTTSSTATYASSTPTNASSITTFSESRVTRSVQCLRIVLESLGQDRCLKGLSVVGNVGFLSKTYLRRENITRKDIDKLINDVRNSIKKEPRKMSSLYNTTHHKTESETSREGVSSEESSAPPEEFLDVITRHVMHCPVILPSGNVVDSSTITKHKEEEAKWGRESSDPFTGVPFTSESGPIHHTSLKQRIDTWRAKQRNRRSVGVAEPSGASSGRSVGVAEPSGATLSEQIINKQAKRLHVSENTADLVRRKRLKLLENNVNSPLPQSTVLEKSRSIEAGGPKQSLVITTNNNSTSPRHDNNFAVSGRHGKRKAPLSGHSLSNYEVLGDVLEDSCDRNRLVNGSSNSVSNGNSDVVVLDSSEEESSVERTLRLLAKHEERLEMF